MGQFTFIPTEVKDVYIIEAKRFGDERGYFWETFNEADFEKAGSKRSTKYPAPTGGI